MSRKNGLKGLSGPSNSIGGEKPYTKASYKASGIIGIPKDVMLLLLGIVLLLMDEMIVGLCAIVAGVISLLISIHYIKMGKDESRKR